MFEKEAIIHAFEATIGIECLKKPIEDFTYEELSDEQQEKAYDFKKGAEFGYNKANEELEKENTGLKEQCSILADSNVCSSTCSEIKKQLAKAKKIIRNCLNLWNNVMTTEETVRALIKEAEQFIKEVEK